MKLLLLTLSILVIKQVFADDCGGEKYKKIDGTGVVMVCRKGVWKVSQRLSKPTGPPCTDDASFSANGTCAADRGHCQQYTDAGADMDRVCPETCESCDACRCQDANQWHSYCPFWAQYCGSSGVLGNWMTSNCRKTCGKCHCKCCSYGGKQHQLGARISLPEKCGVLECQESLIAKPSPLLPGAAVHNVSHPEELTLSFISLQDGADCCVLPHKARHADGTNYDKDAMVEEGWGGVILMPKGPVEAFCCHGSLNVPLADVDGVLHALTTTAPASTTTTAVNFRSGNWRVTYKRNCNSGMGAVSLPPHPAESGKDVESCKVICLNHQECTAILWDVRINYCHLRKDINMASCGHHKDGVMYEII